MTETRTLQVNWPDGLKLRAKPEPMDTSYTGIKVPHRTEVEAIGDPHQYDARFWFQKVCTPEGDEGWLTYRDGDTILLTPLDILSFAGPSVEAGGRLQVAWEQGLRMRAQPEPSMASFTGVLVPDGALVTPLGEPSYHPEGYVFQRVRTSDDRVGWLTRSYNDTVYLVEEDRVEDQPGAETESGTLWVQWLDGLKLRERPEPSMASFTGVVVPYGAKVIALGAPQEYDGYTFQQVRLTDGMVGWLTLKADGAVYLGEKQPDLTTKPVKLAQVSPAAGPWAEMRGVPGGAVEWWIGGGVPLRVVNPNEAGAKIGHAGQWIEVETPAFKRGFVGAQYLKPFTSAGPRPPLRRGESPYIYGVHDRYDRKVLTSVGTTGWVLFTHGIGTDFQGAGGDRSTYYEWERDGFGVIARLNHGYGSSGTIPEPHQYDAFARTCAVFVERSIDPADPQGGCHIWIIGNEMNNPREYPGNDEGRGGHPITPENYADCFNRVYRAIKQVYQNAPGLSPADATVVLGAVDPYNAVAGCNGDWFTRSLRHIEALDGIALHAYTHGTDPQLVASKKLFGDEHKPPKRFPDKGLSWQYYNFYAYRTFMDLIPAQWRHVPVFITETDQVQKDWANANTGWVQEMYAEVDRWNRDPHHQPIYCSLLFRWEAFDGWQIKDKGGVLDDLKAAAQKKYKWTS
ncbi:MAG TPA: hypothetical protein ENN99_12330 [Chloroflexi bacterium]|nr:hypothetical protein [Chloroflexota bacterium]